MAAHRSQSKNCRKFGESGIAGITKRFAHSGSGATSQLVF
jgi:hypothetical protein